MTVLSRALRQATVAWAATAFVLSLAAGARAQQAPAAPAPDLERLAWLGCWELEAQAREGSQEPLQGQRLVCLSPGERPDSLALTSFVDGRVVMEQALVTDGSKQPVDDGGCAGWERAILSADGRRLYQQSETTCAGGNDRSMTGAAVMLSARRWVDIHVVRTDGEREIMIRRYRQASAKSSSVPQIIELGALRTAVHTARLRAVGALTPDDVIEALDLVDAAVVEAMLLETGASFEIDSRLLLRLDDAGVPPQIIDLMVALSFPEYFAVNDEEEPASAPRAAASRSSAVYGYYGGYYTPWFSPFGYGYYYPQPSVIVLPGTRFGGKVVRGRGYTRVRTTQLPSGGLGGLLRSGSRSGGGGNSGTATRADSGSGMGPGGAVSKSGHTKGKSGSSRKAKRRSGS